MKKKKSAGAKYFGKPVTGDPDDAPELLSDFFRHGELRHGEKLIRRGRPPLSASRKPRSRFGSMRMSWMPIAKPARAGRRASMRTCGARENSRPHWCRAASLRGRRGPQTNEIIGFRGRCNRTKAAGRSHSKYGNFPYAKRRFNIDGWLAPSIRHNVMRYAKPRYACA